MCYLQTCVLKNHSEGEKNKKSVWCSRRKANVWWGYRAGSSVVHCGRWNPGADNEVAKSRQRGRCQGQQGPAFHLTFRCQGVEFEPCLYFSEGQRTSLPLPLSSLRTGESSWKGRSIPAGWTFPGAQEEQSRLRRGKGCIKHCCQWALSLRLLFLHLQMG